MTKMAAMPIYGKNPFENLLSYEMQMTLTLGMEYRYRGYSGSTSDSF